MEIILTQLVCSCGCQVVAEVGVNVGSVFKWVAGCEKGKPHCQKAVIQNELICSANIGSLVEQE